MAHDNTKTESTPHEQAEPSSDERKPQLVFAPGCFDSFEGTQEELQELIAEIQRMIETGELFEKARPLTEEEFEKLNQQDSDGHVRH